MPDRRSAWRANDVVAYDGMREVANTAVALLLRLSGEGVIEATEARSEAAEIRQRAFQVDGYDRAAIDAARIALDHRIAELAGLLR